MAQTSLGEMGRGASGGGGGYGVALLASCGFAIASSPPLNRLVLTVSPSVARVGQSVVVGVGNVAPGSRVRIGATLVDRQDRRWRSEGVFVADANGNVNVAEMPSFGGSYLGEDAIGLFWSMQVVGVRSPFVEQGLFPNDLGRVTMVRLTGSAPGKRVAMTTLRWRSPSAE
jgi:hypothetical protein